MAKVDWDDEGLDLASILNFPDESIESLEVEEWDAFTSQNLGPIPEDFIINPMEIAQKTNMPPTPSCTTPEPYQFEDADGLYIFRDDESDKVQDEGKFRSPDEVQEADTFRSPSPISVLKPHNGIKRKRSKRTRPSRTNPWNSSLPYLYTKRANDAKKAHVRRRNKLLPQSVTNQTIRNSLDTAGILSPSPDYAKPEYAAEPRLTKKCAHCEITKTPQWREGPLGPKTLCNACGVRYRSGRLFPEYRPAASPTFVPSIHSNSHKKVVEMRNRGKHQVDQIERALPPQIEFNPVLNYLFDQTRL